MRDRVLAILTAGAVMLGLVGPMLALGTTASADGCYTWSRTLREGMSGDDVRRLQIRVAGWAAYHDFVAIDGAFGPETTAAVKRFQRGYGLTVDGIAGSQTYNKIYALQDGDCTPIHFSYSEFADCRGGFTGGAVSEAKVKSNLLKLMWKLEAVRHKLGNSPVTITSGFRSYACNTGVSNSQHLYGTAADIVVSGYTLCGIINNGPKTSGFSGIIGPPDPDHRDHVHLDSRAENNDDGITNGYYWYFSC
jgi:zinc D-Ala-D-Ala carboxypeptidase